MPNLFELQKHFQNYLLSGDKEIKNVIIKTNKLSIAKRLNVYREGYYLRLFESLTTDYPVSFALIGAKKAEQLSKNYIDAYPSTYRSIRWYGQQFVKMLQTHHANQPWLIELATFEWSLMQAFDSPDSAIVTLEQISQISADKWPNLRFKLIPAFYQTSFGWNVVALWIKYKEKKKFIAREKTSKTNWIIWRKDYDSQFRSVTKAENYFLQSLLAGKNFSEICGGLCEWIDESKVALQAASFLKRLIIDKVINEIIV